MLFRTHGYSIFLFKFMILGFWSVKMSKSLYGYQHSQWSLDYFSLSALISSQQGPSSSTKSLEAWVSYFHLAWCCSLSTDPHSNFLPFSPYTIIIRDRPHETSSEVHVSQSKSHEKWLHSLLPASRWKKKLTPVNFYKYICIFDNISEVKLVRVN